MLEYQVYVSVGARFSNTGCPLRTFSKISQTTGSFLSIIFFADFTVFTIPLSIKFSNNEMAYKVPPPYSLAIHTRIILIQVQQQLQNVQNNQHAYQVSFDGNVLAYLLSESDNDFNGLLESVFTADDLRVLSNKESTDSCNIRFSLRKITSGAFISTKSFKTVITDNYTTV